MAGRLISVRLDDEAQNALAALSASGMSHSEAIRSALVEAAHRLRDTSLAAEAARLADDPADLAEAAAVRGEMEAIRAPW